MRDTVWKNADEAMLWQAVAAENPRRENESWPAYLERIACLAGGVSRDTLILNQPNTLKSYGDKWRAEQHDPRLPYKEPE